ncbi:NUDIX domain-containing protein [Terrabacter carboxydivorans]|uniref:NUDIX domain-containing protein n=1 Tax=Terrabacter carboxydivorans TaxID=619730 RepID=A0ABP5Y9Z6_9MICO
MPIPPYVSHLRTMVGTELLWMPGVTAVVLREVAGGGEGSEGSDEVLLVRRSDNGEWTPVTGIVDPGEEPHVTATREVEEEACVVAEVERLVWVSASGVVTHLNGDLGQYLDHTFRCRWVSGEPRPGDDESTDARWFPLDALPEMRQVFRDRIAIAVDNPADVVLGPVASGTRGA